MHATFEQLINFRDQAPIDVAVSAHIDGCQQCSLQLNELRERQAALRDLPPLEPSPQVFEQLQRRLNSPPVAKPNRRLHVGAAVAAVAALAAINLLSGAPDSTRPGQSQDALVVNQSAPESSKQSTPAVGGESVDTRPINGVAGLDDVDQLKQRAARLQQVLVQLKQIDSGTSSPATQGAIEALEARLAVLDYGLTVPGVEASDQELHRDILQRRVSTLQSMVGVQHAELARQGYHGFRVIPANTVSNNLEQEITW